MAERLKQSHFSLLQAFPALVGIIALLAGPGAEGRPGSAPKDGPGQIDLADLVAPALQIFFDISSYVIPAKPGERPYCDGGVVGTVPPAVRLEAHARWRCDNSDRPRPNRGLVEEPGSGGCPAGMARVAVGSGEALATFCMDRFEASLVRIGSGGESPDWSPYHNPGDERVRAVSLRGAVPQQFISADQAREACANAGKRLCADAEWQRACQGPNGASQPYAWGTPSGAAPSAARPRCHDFVPGGWAPSALCDLQPRASCADPTSRMREPCVAQLPFTGAARTGAYEGCVTPDGIHDLVGNVHEWTAAETGTFRGGYYSDTRRHGEGCLYVTTAHNTAYWDYSTGFRCCADLSGAK